MRKIRSKDERIPILILSVKNSVKDKIKGLSLGADDYLAKPFNLEELILRISRLLTKVSWTYNRHKSLFLHKKYIFGSNQINFQTSKVICYRGEIILTEQETRLLNFLSKTKEFHFPDK